jgi:hypothetical protein
MWHTHTTINDDDDDDDDDADEAERLVVVSIQKHEWLGASSGAQHTNPRRAA